MHRLLYSLLLLFVVHTTAWAIPADPTPFSLQLADGTNIMVRAVGDESFCYLTTLDGIPVVKTSKGYKLKPSQKESLSKTYRERFLQRNAPLVSQMMNKVQSRIVSRDGKKFLERPDASDFVGEKRSLIVLVEFPDAEFSTDPQQWYYQFNKVGYTGNTCSGSVHDYFYDNSSENLDLSFDVYGPVKVSHKYEYYGEDTKESIDHRSGEIVPEVCELLGINDWSEYDWDDDGVVEQVCFIYAGLPESSYTEQTDLIWPHQGYSTWKSDDDYKVSKYVLVSELIRPDTMNGIGTFCHEFSHSLGLPDFYDTDYLKNGSSLGMGYWDIMAAGNYSGSDNLRGGTPVGYTAFERWYFGWMNIESLNYSGRKSLDKIGGKTSPWACAIYKDDRKDEFIILENRQNTKWYKYVSGCADVHGLLVYRVNISNLADSWWQTNDVNSYEQTQLMTIIPASRNFGRIEDTKYYYDDYKTLQGQLFPYGALYIDGESHTDCLGKWYSPDKDGNTAFKWSVEGIEEQNGTITFTYVSGEEDDPYNADFHMSESLAKLNYWIDDAKTARSLDALKVFVMDVSTLDIGLHTLYCQIVNQDGYASDIYKRQFYKLPDTSGKKYEYWFDDEDTVMVAEVEESIMLDATNLEEGFHVLYVRESINTMRSEVTQCNFYKCPPDGELKCTIVIDGKQRDTVILRDEATQIDVYASDLSLGFHVAQFIVSNSGGRQASVVEKLFYKVPEYVSSRSYNMYYSIDEGEWQSSMWQFDEDGTARLAFIDTDNLSAGTHSLHYIITNLEGDVFADEVVAFEKSDVQLGDVNHSGTIDVIDIGLVANYILFGDTNGFDCVAADFNEDGDINISDIGSIASFILNGTIEFGSKYTMKIMAIEQ